MKRSLFNQWIESLRSGNYNQTTEVLRDDGGFCCIGVLGDIHPATHWESNDLFQPLPGYEESDVPCDDTELTEEFLQTLNLPVETQKDLVRLNDEDNASFEYIAEYLESIAGSDQLPIEEDEE